MRFGFILLFLIGLALKASAQSPVDSLFCLATDKMNRQDYDGACEAIQKCFLSYPASVRNPCSDWIRQMCSPAWLEDSAIAASALHLSLLNHLIGNTLSSQDPRFEAMWKRFPWARDYNATKWMYGIALEREGAEDKAVEVWQSIVAEELQAPCHDQAGFFATMSLSDVMLARHDFGSALAYALLSQSSLPERRICSYDEGNHHWIYSNIGLAYAGLGNTEKATHFLKNIMFDEYEEGTEIFQEVDSLIALLERQDTMSLSRRIELATSQMTYKIDTLATNSRFSLLRFTSTIAFNRDTIVVYQSGYSSDRTYSQQFRFGKFWDYPFSKETCQAQVLSSPFYQRVQARDQADSPNHPVVPKIDSSSIKTCSPSLTHPYFGF